MNFLLLGALIGMVAVCIVQRLVIRDLEENIRTLRIRDREQRALKEQRIHLTGIPRSYRLEEL